MPEHLNALDTMFLELEQADPNAHMHIGAALLFDASAAGAAPDIAAIRDRLDTRKHLLPRFRQRLSRPHTSALSWLEWVEAEEFDIDAHVREAALPGEGGRAELLDWLGDFWSHRLDRSRPLWELVLLKGLEDGRWALVTKTHHCLVDGVGSIDTGTLLLDGLDAGAEPPRVADENGNGGRGLSLPLAGLVARGARTGLEVIRHPGTVLETVSQAAAAVDLLVREEVIASPSCSINGPLGGTRRFDALTFDLDAIKAIKRKRGGTVNDVALAMCTGALRRLLLARGEEPPAGLRAQVPVNVRTDDEEHALGNRLASLFVELPVAIADPAARYEYIVEHSRSLKSSGTQTKAGKAMVTFWAAMPPAMGEALGRLVFGHARAFNLTITNVPGPTDKLYAFGSELDEVLPLVPLFADHRIGIAVVSYGGKVVFGLHADRLHMPDLDVLAEGLRQSVEELTVKRTRKVAAVS